MLEQYDSSLGKAPAAKTSYAGSVFGICMGQDN